MHPTTQIDTELVAWARENLPKIPDYEGEFYDKKISGMLFKPGPKSWEHESKLRRKCQEYADMKLEDYEDYFQFGVARNEFAKKHLLGRTKEIAILETPFKINLGYNTSVGANFYANANCTILDWSVVKIGDNVALGPNCTLTCVNHVLDGSLRANAGMYAFPIIIDDNVWIGADVVILSGVHIGEGAVVGAGSVVTKSVPPHTVVAGNPARIIKQHTQGPALPEAAQGP